MPWNTLLDDRTTVLEFRGRAGFGIDRWVEVPFEVPAGVRRITVRAGHDRYPRLGPSVRNVLDLGIAGPDGFRGWSGGARTGFTLAATDATPGYLPGPVGPGTWTVLLGPVVLSPFGMRWWLRVELERGETVGAQAFASPPPERVPGTGPGWYRGDLHLHSVHSDGDRDLDEVAAAALGAGLDFLASTEHNTNAANRVWGAHAPGGLLVLPGEEVTTRHGHWLAVGLPPDACLDWRYGPRSGSFPPLAAKVRAGGGLVVAAHPAVPIPGSAWTFGYRHVDAVEVWNGEWNADDEVSLRIWHALLRRGRRVAAVAGSDSHSVRQPVGRPQTVVHASELSRPAIVTALRQGRGYLAGSADVAVDLTVSAGSAVAGPGATLTVPAGEPVTVSASVTGAPGAALAVITDAGPVARRAGTVRLTDPARFVRVEVRTGRLGRMVALTNPVRLVPA